MEIISVFRYIEEALQEIPLNAAVMGDQETEAKLRQINPGTPVPATLAPSRPASHSWGGKSTLGQTSDGISKASNT